MQNNSLEEWQRLTALYAQMGEIEIRELQAGIGDLTETAQQVLRDELKKRGMSEKPAAVQHRDRGHRELREDGVLEDEEHRSEYSWKVVLCNCVELADAQIKTEVLRRAGLEGWIERRGSRDAVPWADEYGAGDLQVLVAADQLEEAQWIISQPVPQEVMDVVAAAHGAAEYELPTCPGCGAEDPILESAEPTNTWTCDSCGSSWTEPDTTA